MKETNIQKLMRVILNTINEYQEVYGDISAGDIIGALECSKLAYNKYVTIDRKKTFLGGGK